MNTAFLLMAQYGKAIVHLDEICGDLLSQSPSVANLNAKAERLPFPAFKAANSAKAKWLVNVTDLAAYLDKQRDLAAASIAKRQ